ncbi:MAG: anti-phage defense ZorAB system ZorA [Deltaproteobacteria bacterium]|nr:anti-phage defense ZorAB system ZorA [Deltaproteobacteria bacterium]
MLTEFFSALDPYLGMIPLGAIGDVLVKNEFNAIWCGATLLYFLFCIALLGRRALPIRRALGRVIRPLAETDKASFASQFEAYAETVCAQRSLRHAWREFDESLVKPGEGDPQLIRNTHEPGLYFNDGTIVQPVVHTRFFDTVPSQLVGLGILGTFLGLAAGVGLASGKLDSGNPAEIQQALSNLLNGASLAFMTSIFGLGLSLVFLWIERLSIGSVHRRLNTWVERLERCVELVTPEKIALQQLEHAKRQSKQLETFNDKLIFALETALDERVGKRLVPELEKVVRAIENLRADRGASSEAAVEQLVEKFSQTLTGTAGREMTEMATTLRTLGERFQGLVEALGASQQQARDVLNEAAQNLRESLAAGSGAAVAGVERALEGMVRELQAASRGLVSEVSGAGVSMRESGQAAARDIAAALGGFADGVGRLERMSAAQAELAPRLEELAAGLRDAGTTVTEAHRGFVGALEPTRSAVRGLEAVGTRLADSLTTTGRFVEDVAAAGQTMRAEQEKMARAWQDYATRFQGIDQSLQRAFVKLDEGVRAYTEQIRQFHRELDEHVSKSIGSLASVTSELHETIEDLSLHLAARR